MLSAPFKLRLSRQFFSLVQFRFLVRRRAGTLAGLREKSAMNPRCSLAVGALALISAFPAIAADKETDAVVVTATRQATRSNELLSDVSVITREEIEKAGQSTVEQLLARQPGIEYSANGGPGTNSSIFIRGANADHTLVLVDGQRINSVSAGGASFSRLPLSQIERIEILRGPASSLYGADAIGGVIQIFTRRGEGPARFNASAGYGTYNTSEASAGVSGGTDIVSYSLQAGYFGTQGFNAIRNPANFSFNPDRDGYRNQNVSASLALRPAPGHEFGLNLLNSDGVSAFDNGPGAASNKENISTFSAYSRNRLASAWTSTLRTGRTTDDSTSRSSGSTDSLFRTDQDQLSWQNDIKLPVGQALLAAEYLKQKLTSDTVFTVNERTIRSLLAGWNGSIGEHRLQGNLRHDENSQFGGKTTGFAGYGYQFTPDWRARASYGTAFKAPTFNQLYFPNTFGPTFAGNPNLKPEFAHNREIGLDWEKAGHRFSAVYFNNKVSDLIIGFPLQNVSSATLEGTTFSYAGSRGNWDGGATLDLQRPRDDTTGKRLIWRADQQFKSHLGYTLGAWNIGGEWQLVGQRFEDAANTQRLGSYSLVNLFAEYRLERDWKIFARANNIFDKQYELVKDFATPGANVFVGIRYTPQ